jgi:outer membrane receptor protein involved in Fe transport
MSAFTQEDLTRSQVAGGPDLMTQVPNMTFTKTNFTSYSIQIRGIGTQAISATTDPAVAVAFNNTPFISNHFFEQEFYDLERVEVLRGPQGTLYGRNATAGVVNIISAKPKNHFEARLSGDVANYNSSRLEGMINLPLVEDKAALRIAGAWTKRDGFVKNLLTNQQTDGRDLWSTRVTLGLTPTDKFAASLIWEKFEENDDRLRSGKQLCHKDPGPLTIAGLPVRQGRNDVLNPDVGDFSQGCIPASLYSPDSFQTPNGFALPYYGAAAVAGAPVRQDMDPYVSGTQSRNLREIETYLKPEYKANADTVELQLKYDLTPSLNIASETGFYRDYIFSFEDYNRFDTVAGLFIPNAVRGSGDEAVQLVDQNGVFCDPQLGCSDRVMAGDVATATSQQFSQEFRVSSSFEGPFNFNVGANFLRYDTEVKYYVFINTLTSTLAGSYGQPWIAGQSDNHMCYDRSINGYNWSNPNAVYDIGQGCLAYIDPNNIHNLNDEGRNYFLSKNPYKLLSYSVFGEAYYNLTDSLKLTAGLRWTIDKKTAPQNPSWLLADATYGLAPRKIVHQEWREPTGRLAIDWKPKLSFTDETLVYASYVRGYKAGGANPPPPIVVLPASCPPNCNDPDRNYTAAYVSLSHPEAFKAEFVNAYELGTKNTLLDGRLTLNLGAFYYDYTGYQISQIVDRSAVNLNFDAKIWGLEMEADWRPIENLRLGFKGGYENTRLADGSQAIDLMDRTAGHNDWVLLKPFPPAPSNCIVPVWLISRNNQLHQNLCYGYQVGVDPATSRPYVQNPPQSTYNTFMWGTNYPGFNPASAPNNGEGFAKDVSGNALPNAPHFTATITADYTVPLPNSWLMTLHTDLYYQSEAWTRVFNDPGYDKLKAYNNINLAAIFSNEDAGWQVMAYVKNLLNRDSITGAFLNSDDTGLTTNVFLTEPRLYGIRVTKNWTDSPWWSAHMPKAGVWQPMRLEAEGYYGRFGHDRSYMTTPNAAYFASDFPFPFYTQKDIVWVSGGGVKFTYQPDPKGWFASAAVRYGRAGGAGAAHGQQELSTETCVINGKYCRNPSQYGIVNFFETTTKNEENHTIADFMVGKDIGLGAWSDRVSASNLTFGLRYAKFNSSASTVMHGRPDLYFPSNQFIYENGSITKYPAHFHRFSADLNSGSEFEGAGPSLAWEGSVPVVGNPDGAGQFGLDIGVGGAVLFGKQKMQVHGERRGDYANGFGINSLPQKYDTLYDTPVSISRSKSVTVPAVRANLGLSYTVGSVKLSGGYRTERYYKAVDAGYTERKVFDRSFDGPYFKVSVGFGG